MRRLGLAIATAALLAVPTSASADTVTLTQDEGGFGIDFAALDPDFHPGDPYPSTITGPAGTVNDINVTAQVNHGNPGDLDVQLVSPAGTGVFLFSDTCNADLDVFNNLSFDDASTMTLPSGPCDASQTYDVTNQAPNPDIYSPPAPAALPLNALSFFNGQPSGGAWRLFGMDDTMNAGGKITTWSITFDFTPPAATPPAAAPITSPAPAPIVCPKGKKLKKGKCVKKKKRKKKKG